MRLCKAILSLFCAFFIIFCSIAQFHHHADDGTMLIFTCKATECEDNHYHKHNQKHNNLKGNTCKHGCHDGHHQNEKQCSLKINIVTPEHKPNNELVYWCIVDDEIVGHTLNIIKHILEFDLRHKSQSSKVSNRLLRAPPFYYNQFIKW